MKLFLEINQRHMFILPPPPPPTIKSALVHSAQSLSTETSSCKFNCHRQSDLVINIFWRGEKQQNRWWRTRNLSTIWCWLVRSLHHSHVTKINVWKASYRHFEHKNQCLKKLLQTFQAQKSQPVSYLRRRGGKKQNEFAIKNWKCTKHGLNDLHQTRDSDRNCWTDCNQSTVQ